MLPLSWSKTKTSREIVRCHFQQMQQSMEKACGRRQQQCFVAHKAVHVESLPTVSALIFTVKTSHSGGEREGNIIVNQKKVLCNTCKPSKKAM